MRRSVILIPLGLIGLLIYAAFAVRFPVDAFLATPRANIGSATHSSPWAALAVAVAGIVLHAAYTAAVLLFWRRDGREPRLLPLIWLYALAAGVVLMLIWPINSTDLFD